jgi:hypothetical protein
LTSLAARDSQSAECDLAMTMSEVSDPPHAMAHASRIAPVRRRDHLANRRPGSSPKAFVRCGTA